MKKSLVALAFGTMGLGIAEFGMMSVLSWPRGLMFPFPKRDILFRAMRWEFAPVRRPWFFLRREGR